MKRRKAAEKERERLKIDVIENIANPSLKFEIEHFKLFGSLRKSETEVHNTIPNTTSKSYQFFSLFLIFHLVNIETEKSEQTLCLNIKNFLPRVLQSIARILSFSVVCVCCGGGAGARGEGRVRHT